jgi:ketosteroid isomerase-like protein
MPRCRVRDQARERDRFRGRADRDVRAENDVVQYGRTAGAARESGKPFDIPERHGWTAVDGRVINAAFYIDSAAMLDALAP